MPKLFFRDIAFASALCSLISLVFSWNDAALICLMLSSIVFVYLFVTSRTQPEGVPTATAQRARAKGYAFWYLLGAIVGLFFVSGVISTLLVDTIELLGLTGWQFSAVYIPLMTLAGLPIAWLDLRRLRQE
jgi:hypothetical protein